MRTILLIVLILLLLGALPTWPYSASWGYYPSGGLGLVLIILVILALTGRLYTRKHETRQQRLMEIIDAITKSCIKVRHKFRGLGFTNGKGIDYG